MRRLAVRLRGDRERGSEVIEAVIAVPAFLLFIGLIVFAGRVAIANQAVESAAAEAARTASVARTAGDARTTARTAAEATLANQGLECLTSNVAVDTAGFAAPVGTPAQVSATVTCRVDAADLALPGVPGSRTVTVTMSSPIDTYRGR